MQSMGIVLRNLLRPGLLPGSNIRSVTTIHYCWTSNKTSVKENPKNERNLNETNPLSVSFIKKCSSFNELLSLANVANAFFAKEILLQLGQLCVSGKADRITLEKDQRFKKLISKVQNSAQREIGSKPMSTSASISKSVSSKNPETKVSKKPEIKIEKISPKSLLQEIAYEKSEKDIISEMNTTKLINVLKTFSRQKVRSQQTLQLTTERIVAKNEILTLKDYADILYSMAKLNFFDNALLSYVSKNVQKLLQSVNNEAIFIGSIVTSVGYLRFRDEKFIDALGDWIVKNKAVCRPKDLASVISTLASVNYGTQLAANILKSINIDELTKVEQLDLIWSLVVLDLVDETHYKRVLANTFINSLKIELPKGQIPGAIKRKLLNINGAAISFPDYNGPTQTDNQELLNYPFEYTNNKKVLIGGLQDALKNLLPSSFLRLKTDTKMGFVIDAECVLDSKQTPLDLMKANDENVFRVAFFVLDFPEVCYNQHLNQPCGFSALQIKLLRKQGYHIVEVPFVEFNTSEKIINRVKYLDDKLKQIVNKT